MPDNQINPHASFKYFNLNLLSEVTGIGRDKMYKNMKGSIKTLTDDQKKEIFDILEKQLSELKNDICD